MVTELCQFMPAKEKLSSFHEMDGKLWYYARKLVWKEVRDRVEREMEKKVDGILEALEKSGILPEGLPRPEYWDPFESHDITPITPFPTTPVRAFVANPFAVMHHFPSFEKDDRLALMSCGMKVICQLPEAMKEKVLVLLETLTEKEGVDLPLGVSEAVLTWNNEALRTLISARFEKGLTLFGTGRTYRTNASISFSVTSHQQVVPKFVGIRDIGVFLLPPSVRDPDLFHALPGKVLSGIPGLSTDDIPLDKAPDEWKPKQKERVAMTLLAAAREQDGR